MTGLFYSSPQDANSFSFLDSRIACVAFGDYLCPALMSKKPGKKPSKPAKEDQNDFWDLGDDDLDTEPEAVKEEGTPEKKAISIEKSPTKTDSEESPEDLEIEKEEPLKEDLPPEKPAPEKAERKLVRVSGGNSRKRQKDDTPTSTIEKISLFAVVACLIGALVWGVSAFLNEAPQGELITFKEDYPAKGQNATIAAVDTWWRKPIRTGDNADAGIVLDANLIPCARIKLIDGGSTILRVTFRDDEKQLVGDTINLTVEDGKFVKSGSDEIEINSTAGFKNASRINAYTNEDINPWSLAITERGTGEESGPLVKARISAKSSEK